jgi:hypothetical protein
MMARGVPGAFRALQTKTKTRKTEWLTGPLPLPGVATRPYGARHPGAVWPEQSDRDWPLMSFARRSADNTRLHALRCSMEIRQDVVLAGA